MGPKKKKKEKDQTKALQNFCFQNFKISKLVQDQLSMADFQIITNSMVAECLKM